MTRMLPSTIHSNVRSGAERKLFDVIRDEPGTDDWVCVHGLGLARHSQKRRGEIDFALVTPDAVLVLEVKGGRVERRDGRWIHTDRYGVAHAKGESPFDQASSAMFALERELREQFGAKSRVGNVLLGYGVLFPDVEFDSLGVEAARELVYDRRDGVKPLARWVRSLVHFTRKTQKAPRNGLDKREVEALVDYLRGDFELIPSFDVTATDVNRGLAKLTRQQAAALPGFDRYPRLVVEGAAGTGKSMLAVETARRDAVAGRRVLLLCYNRLLAAKLRAVTAGTPGVSVHHAHDFMREVIAASTLAKDFERAVARESNTKRVFDFVYPEFASLALAEGRAHPFDSVIVDEAQDILTPGFVDVLDQAVRDGIERGRWRMFLDANEQAAVYGQLDPGVLERLESLARTTVLSMNCRNTTQIGLATRAIANPRSAALATHQGEHVERRWYQDAPGLAKELRAVLNELAHQEVPPGSVTVIYGRLSDGLERVLASAGVQALSPDRVSLLGTREGKHPTHATASAFKGLENDVVIFAGVEKLDDDWWRAVTYVGLSRARVKLYVLIHAGLRAAIDQRFDAILREAMTEGAT